MFSIGVEVSGDAVTNFWLFCPSMCVSVVCLISWLLLLYVSFLHYQTLRSASVLNDCGLFGLSSLCIQ